MVVGGVVVGHNVQLDPGMSLGNLLEEGEEFAVAVPLVASVRGDLAGRDFQGGEQSGGPVSAVFVGTPFGVVEAHW